MDAREEEILALKERIAQIESEGSRRTGSFGERGPNEAFKRIERLFAHRDYARSEIERRLASDGFDEASATEAIERAVACGLIDDDRFAAAFVRGRVARGRGMRGIIADLAERGIDAESLPGWPYEFIPECDDAETARALEVLRKKPPSAKNRREAAYRRLIQRGFASDVAGTAVRRWLEELDR